MSLSARVLVVALLLLLSDNFFHCYCNKCACAIDYKRILCIYAFFGKIHSNLNILFPLNALRSRSQIQSRGGMYIVPDI